MARTKGRKCLPPRSHYEATQARSQAQVAAGVPPTRRQFELAFDYYDEPTVLDYLKLNPSIQDDMATTEAFISQYGRSPPAHGFPSLRIAGDGTGSIGIDSDPFVWFWPYRWHRLLPTVTLFAFAARNQFEDVIAWLFCDDRDSVGRMSATLVHVFPETLREAVAGCHATIIEKLLTSPVFLELMSAEAQQSALDDALRATNDYASCKLLITHGATIDDRADNSLVALCYQESMAGPASALLESAVRCGSRHVLERGIREAVVVGHSLLVVAVESVNLEAVERLLSRGFVDVDARTNDGLTALMVSARMNDFPRGNQRPESRRQVIRCLLEAGTDTSVLDPHGRTALHIAIANSNLVCVEELLDHFIATRGVEAVHDDAIALALVVERRHVFGDHSELVLAVLLDQGACSSACGELTMVSHTCSTCEDSKRCLRDLALKKVVRDEWKLPS